MTEQQQEKPDVGCKSRVAGAGRPVSRTDSADGKGELRVGPPRWKEARMSGNSGGGECCGQSSVGKGRWTLGPGRGEAPQGLMLDLS